MTMIRIPIDFFYFTLIALNMPLLELTKDYLTKKYSKKLFEIILAVFTSDENEIIPIDHYKCNQH